MKVDIHYPSTEYQLINYPGGEKQIRLPVELQAKLKEKEVVTVEALVLDGNLTTLALLVDAIKQEANKRVRLYLPYMPYARADRRFIPGDCFGLKVACNQLLAMDLENIYSLDIHSSITRQLLGKQFHNISPNGFIYLVLHGHLNWVNTTVLLPDEGAKRYKLVSTIEVDQCHKIRHPETGVLSGFSVPRIDNPAALIVDDICDGGGTFIGIADALADQHKELYLYVTHGIFSKGLTDLSKKFKKVFCVNNLYNLKHECLEVLKHA